MLVVRKVENVATGGGNKPKLPCVAPVGEMWTAPAVRSGHLRV